MSEESATPAETEAAPAPTPAVAPTEASADVAAAYNDRIAFEQYRDANPFKRAALYDKNQDAIERGRAISQSPVAPPSAEQRNPFAEARERLRNFK